MLCTWVIADDYISDKGLGLEQNSQAIFPWWKTKLYSGYIALVEEVVSLEVTLLVSGWEDRIRPWSFSGFQKSNSNRKIWLCL